MQNFIKIGQLFSEIVYNIHVIIVCFAFFFKTSDIPGYNMGRL